MSRRGMPVPSWTAALSSMLLWSFVLIELIEGGTALRAKQGTDPNQQIHEVRRAPKPQFDASTGTTKYELLYQRTNKETGEYTSFSYTTERNNDLVIWLDDIDGVHEVDCGSEVLNLTVSQSCSLLSKLDDWRAVNGQRFLIYGGGHWGCLGPGGDKSPLFRVMTGPGKSTAIDSENVTLSFPTGPASPFAFFGK
eukprot:1886483-Rhodomonas_salina.1